MWSPFRKKHLTILLELSLKKRNSLDYISHKYFKENRALGSKDRLWLKKGLYEIIKNKELLAAHKVSTTEEVVSLYCSEDSPIGKDNSHLPSNVQVSFPKWLFQKVVDSLGYKEAMEFCHLSNEIAPITIRINPLKTTRDAFYEKYKNELGLKKCPLSEDGLTLEKNIRFDSLPEFKEGHFEPQDEASQLISQYVKAKPGMHILDYCAASGGKTLSFAPHMKGKGEAHLHDIRKKPLDDAKKRLKRAGIQNFQIYFNEEDRLLRLKNRMDCVLVDAPCSCSGTLRRRPDHKWILNEKEFDSLLQTQKEILKKAEEYVKDGGKLIYATCSVLKEENQDQTKFFLDTSKRFSLDEEHIIPLTRGGSDAMYLSIFTKNSLE